MPKSTKGRFLVAAGVTAVTAGVACLAYGNLVERHWHRLRELNVPILADGSEPLTILHLSDLHMLAGDERQRTFLQSVADRPYDLVVVTGDFLGEPQALGVVLGTLARLRPHLGAVAVLGSNDYYAPQPRNWLGYLTGPSRLGSPLRPRNPARELTEGLEAMGWMVLSNRRARIGDVELAGLDDAHIDREDLGVPVRPEPEIPTRLRLGVTHSPYLRVLDAFEDARYDLVLAGHTHGGQVCVPGIGALATNCDLPRDRVRGLSRWGRSNVHVSGGLGTSKYAPFRFACRPEATLLHVTAARP